MKHDDAIYVLRDDLIVVVPASEESMNRWLRMEPVDLPIRTLVVPPGTTIDDWRTR